MDGSCLRRVLRTLTKQFHVIAIFIIIHKVFRDLLAEKHLLLILLREMIKRPTVRKCPTR